MKKFLIATSALVIAGSAFASDVSGYAVSAYSTNENKVGDADKVKKSALYSESEVYVSGSKTTANGLTFGATFTVGFDGDNTAHKSSKIIETGADVTIDAAYTHINSYVSGAFGKVATGRLSSAGRSIGGSSIAAGNGTVFDTSHGIARNRTNRGTLVFTTPTINGVTAAYSSDFGHKFGTEDTTAKSFAINYADEFSGVSVTAAYNADSVTSSTADTKVSNVVTVVGTGTKTDQKAMGFSIGYEGANFSYTTADSKVNLKNGETNIVGETFARNKEVRIGLDYTISGATLGYSENKETNNQNSDNVKSTLMSVSYVVSEGLSVFAEQKTKKTTVAASVSTTTVTDDKSMYVGTKISF